MRALQYRLWNITSRKLIYPAVLRYLGRWYESLFTVDIEQIPAWPKSIIVDVDDPVFNAREVSHLNFSKVKAIIVTTERAKTIFQQLGVVRPIYVIPQGVPMEQIDPYKVQQIHTQLKGLTDVVIGYHAPTLTLSHDGPRRAREGLDDLDLLFAAVEEARKMEPRIKLWLLGTTSESVRKYAAGKPWIKLFGYIPLSEVMNYVSTFDIGVYPRTFLLPPGRFSVKIAQYMACGIPIVSTNVEESFIVKEGHCGIICDSQENFAKTLGELARSVEMRLVLGKRGKTYAETHLNWSVLIQRYEDILID